VDYALNRILAVPNWSFFDPGLCAKVRSLLGTLNLDIHYVKGDIDHQRTVIAFSGKQDDVFAGMSNLAELLLPSINIAIQNGVHPRVGALDVAPFVILEGYEFDLIEGTRTWASNYSRTFDVSVRLYEKSAEKGNEWRLPYLRGQVGELTQKNDFESEGQTKWGTTIIGVRDFLIAANINLATNNMAVAKRVATEIRQMREQCHPEFVGVRALGFALESRRASQLSLNFTEPDITSFDPVFCFAKERFEALGVGILDSELIGVIRERDLSGTTNLTIDPSQVVR
jgi:glutamate formiminotransferase